MSRGPGLDLDLVNRSSSMRALPSSPSQPPTAKHPNSVEPDQMVTMGFMLQSASAEGVKVTGDVKVAEAEFCD